MQYLHRVFDKILAEKLESSDAVLIEGPKWCGKTTTAEQIAESVLYMQRPETRDENMRIAQVAPSALLEGKTPRLIDEWQLAPNLWDAVRFEADKRQQFGQFILTGSTVPPKVGQTRHSGTGRIARMKMRTMSLYESQDSSGAVSLASLFAGDSLPIAGSDSSIDELAFLLCRGGWPRAVGKSERVALQQARNYLDAVVETDISEVDGVDRDAQRARHIMRSYARFISSQGKVSSMAADLLESDAASDVDTVRSYLCALRSLFVIEELAAWNPNLRSKSALRTTATRHFCDPSIAAAALAATPAALMRDFDTFGLLFESLCIRDLRSYAQGLDGLVFHYRDSAGLECDAVICLKDGRYALVEVKLGGQSLVDEGIASLCRLRDKIDTDKMGEPAFMMVLVGTGKMSYPSEEGVFIVPIKTLGP